MWVNNISLNFINKKLSFQTFGTSKQNEIEQKLMEFILNKFDISFCKIWSLKNMLLLFDGLNKYI
jgi:hypothetical protein